MANTRLKRGLRATFLGLAVKLLLAAVGIAVQAVREILQPRQGPAPFTLLVLVGVVILKEALFRFVLREANSVKSTAVSADAWHHRSDVITSLAAVMGISVALIGGTGFEAADDIAWNGWRLLRPALDELMDTAPARTLGKQIRAIAAAVPGIDRVEKCVARKMGYHYFVDMHVEVDPAMTVERAHGIGHVVKDRIRAALPDVHDVLVHIEPRK